MYLNICDTRYQIRVTTSRILNGDGGEVDALADEAARAIYISSKVPPAERVDLLSHELVHPLAWYGAEPRTQEDAARLARTVSRMVREQLKAQGGIAALEAMIPDAWANDGGPRLSMIPVKVGAFTYQVKIRSGMPKNKAGMALWNEREIWISSRVNPKNRLEVLGHEYLEAWLFHYPPADEHEKKCDLFASLFCQLFRSLCDVGGVEALERLTQPSESPFSLLEPTHENPQAKPKT